MLSNLLLVMGMCFFFGGIDRLEQHFNPVVAQTAASLLALAVGSLIIPTAFHAWSDGEFRRIVRLMQLTNSSWRYGSRTPVTRYVPYQKWSYVSLHFAGTSVILLVVYGCYLFFQLKSHTEIYNAPSPKVEKRRQKVNEGDASRGIAQIGKMSASMAGEHAQNVKLQEPDDEEEEPQLSVLVAVLTLVISTVFVALCAEFMVRYSFSRHVHS